MNPYIKLFAAAILAAATAVAQADLITSDTIADPTVVDFNGIPEYSNVTGPIQIGAAVGMDITAATITGGVGLYTHFDGWGLCSNGDWGDPQTYVSSQSGAGIRIAFNDGPVSQVGGFMNDCPDLGGDFIITALDAGMNVLESYNLDDVAAISTPGGFNEGAFRGIVRSSADIAYFEVTGESPALDNLTFIAEPDRPVPLSTAGLVLMAALLALVGLVAARRV